MAITKAIVASVELPPPPSDVLASTSAPACREPSAPVQSTTVPSE